MGLSTSFKWAFIPAIKPDKGFFVTCGSVICPAKYKPGTSLVSSVCFNWVGGSNHTLQQPGLNITALLNPEMP